MKDETNMERSQAPSRLLWGVQVLLIIVVVLLLGAHVMKWDVVRVDGVALTLLGLLLVIPLADLIRKVKLGEFEAEIGRDEIAKTQAKATVDLPISPEGEDQVSEKRVRALLRDDPRLALAKVRIELEDALKRLYTNIAESEPDWKRLSLSRLVNELVRREILNSYRADALRDVIALANRAVHGERVEPAAAEDLALLGIRLTRELEQLNRDRFLLSLNTVIITPDEVEQHRSARYRMTTVVPLVKNPQRNTYILDQDGLDSFLDGYEEYAEFIVAIEKI